MERSDVAPRLACFLAQQAGEKALKARLMQGGVPFPRIHDLLALRALLPDGETAGVSDADLAALSLWAVEARYPADLPEATAADARLAIEASEALLSATRRDLDPTDRSPDARHD